MDKDFFLTIFSGKWYNMTTDDEIERDNSAQRRANVAIAISILAFLSIVTLFIREVNEIERVDMSIANGEQAIIFKVQALDKTVKQTVEVTTAVADSLTEYSQKLDTADTKADNALTAAQKADLKAQDALARVVVASERLKETTEKLSNLASLASENAKRNPDVNSGTSSGTPLANQYKVQVK